MKKNNIIWIYLLVISELLIILTANSCKKEEDTNIITDIDGNVYHIVTIGSQVWMAENLKTTKYNDGTDIPLVAEDSAWMKLVTPGYCWYNNDKTTYKDTYGALYNWFITTNGKLCPVGWDLPGSDEFLVLRDSFGGWEFGGGPHKMTGTIEAGDGLWYYPNEGATNQSGFTAIPAGVRIYLDGSFYGMGEVSHFWTSDYDDVQNIGLHVGFDYDNATFVWMGREKQQGMSIRCIKD